MRGGEIMFKIYGKPIFRGNRKISLRIVADKYGAVYGSIMWFFSAANWIKLAAEKSVDYWKIVEQKEECILCWIKIKLII